jgi:alkylation response protein AidB-like acyl-CoA dehydrogenase
MQKRKIFGGNILNFQAKAFELSDFYAKLESARLMLYKACWLVDRGEDFRQAGSLAKYLSVEVAREVTLWAADIFGAASVIQEHPIHKYPMDVWGSSLGEGTQDVQKLIIFREFMKRIGKPIADIVPHQKKSRLEPHPILSQVKVKCNLTEPLTQQDWELD